MPCLMPPGGGPCMHLCVYHLPVLPRSPVHIHAVCQGHHLVAWADLFMSLPSLISIMCSYCFPEPTPAAWVLRSECGMYPRARMLWHRITTFQHHHLVTKAHQLARLQCPAMLLCRVVVWLLHGGTGTSVCIPDSHTPHHEAAQACLFTCRLCRFPLCGIL